MDNMHKNLMSHLKKIGDNLAKFFLEVTDEYEITSKINCITTDNAANNGVMGDRLEIAAKI